MEVCVRWTVGLLLLAAGCWGGSTTAPPEPTPPPVRPDLALSTAAEVAPDGLLAVAFDKDGLNLDGQILAPAVTAGDHLEPEGITEFGEGVASLRAAVRSGGMPQFVGRKALVSVPADVPYKVPKAILRSLSEGGVKSAWLGVRTADDAASAVPMRYPRGVFPTDEQGPRLRVLLSPEGLTMEGDPQWLPGGRRSFRCDPDCSAVDHWPLAEVTRLAARASVRGGADTVEIVPHNDVRWDVVIAAMDAARDDLRFGGPGAVFLPEQVLAGTRLPRRGVREHLEDLLEVTPPQAPAAPPAP